MKKYAVFIILLISSYLSAYEYLSDYFIMSQMFFPTDEGDNNEQKLLEYIEEYCVANGFKYNKSKIDNEEIATNSYNFEISLTGLKPESGNLILIIPLDSIMIRQEYRDVSVSHIVALEILNYFKNNPIDKNLLLIFSGANNRENDEPWGISQFLQNKTGQLDQAIVTVIELINSNNPIEISGSSKRRAIPLAILKIIHKLTKDRFGFVFHLEEIDKARFGVLNTNKRLNVLLDNGITAVRFSNYDEKSKFFLPYYNEEMQKNTVLFFTEWLKQLDKIEPNFEKDHNYQVFKFNDFYFYISEFIQVLIYLLLIFFTIFSGKMIYYFRYKVSHLTLKSMPYFIFLFVSFYLLSFVPHLMGKIYNILSGAMFDYTGISFFYFLVSFLVPFFLVSGFLEYFHKFPFPRHNIVYMNGALFFSYLNIVMLLIIDISLVYIFLITVIALLASHLTGKFFFLKYVFYIISFFPFIILVFRLSHGNANLIKDSFDSPYFQHFMLCLLSFPFFLLLLRINIMNRMRFKMIGSRTTAIINTIFLLTVFIVFYAVVFYSSFSKGNEGGVNVVNDYINGESYIEVFSNSKIGKLILFNNDDKTEVVSGKYKKIPIVGRDRNYQADITKRSGGVNVVLNFQDKVERIEALLFCPKGVTFFNTNFRYAIDDFSSDADFDVYKIMVPRNPGNTVVFDFDLIPGYEYKLIFDIYYNGIGRSSAVYANMDIISEITIDKDRIYLLPD